VPATTFQVRHICARCSCAVVLWAITVKPSAWRRAPGWPP
jgi:hypothetical protein